MEWAISVVGEVGGWSRCESMSGGCAEAEAALTDNHLTNSSRDLRVLCVGGGSDEIMSDLGLRMAEQLARGKSAKL